MRCIAAGFCVMSVIVITMVLCGNILLASVVRNECNTAFNEAVYQSALEMYENEGNAEKEITTEADAKRILELYFKSAVSNRRTTEVEIKGFDDKGVIDAVGYVQYFNLLGKRCSAGTRKTIVIERNHQK